MSDELLTEEEIRKAVYGEAPPIGFAKFVYQRDYVIAKAQLAKLQSLGWKSPDQCKNCANACRDCFA